MDLGLKGKRAIVCASSRGLGRACAEALAADGVDLVVNGRDAKVLDATANDLARRFSVTINAVAADVVALVKLRNEAAREDIPPMPLFIDNADSEEVLSSRGFRVLVPEDLYSPDSR